MTRSSRRWLWLLFLVPIALGLLRLHFDVEVLNLLPTELPVVRGLKLYQENFANARELIVTVQAPDAETAESAARELAEALRRETNHVTDVTWQPPWLERPGDAAELIAHLWLNQPPARFAELTDRLASSNRAATLTAAREQLTTSFSPGDIARLSYDPYGLTQLPESATAGVSTFGQGQELFASPDGTFRIVFVQASSGLPGYRECAAWLAYIKSRVATLPFATNASVKLGYTGRPAFVTEIAGGMERDMTESVGFTAVIIGLLFWLAHRRWLPMLWLVFLLGVILAATLALGGLIFGEINVVSLGFAAILLGLAVDYGVVHYQEALANPDAIVPEIRRAIGPSIFWAAVTTISAFLVLNFSGLPGLGRLGSLVAIGVALSAFVMLFVFLPPLFGHRLKLRAEKIAAGLATPNPVAATTGHFEPVPHIRRVAAAGASVALVLAALGVLLTGWPKLDRSANALRPRKSAAYDALDAIKARFSKNREPLWVLTTSRDPAEIAQRLDRVTPALARAVSNNLIASYTLPTSLWPRWENQTANRAAVFQLVAERESLRTAALTNGFSTNAVTMLDNIFATWKNLATSDHLVWPTNRMSRWIMEKMVAQPRGELLAIGFVFPAPNAPVNVDSVSEWANDAAHEGFLVSGWELLGDGILRSVEARLWRVVLPMVLLVLLSLWLAFRRVPEILLSLAVLALSGLGLLAVMRLAGWSWNLLNLMSLPLILGSGVDYGIFMQLALRRHAGDWRAAHRSVGRALLLCGGTAVAGFGSLAWSTNAGMASLGAVCAVGIGFNMLISVYLLPVWWQTVAGKSTIPGSTSPPSTDTTPRPSKLYDPALWRAALVLARVLPASVTTLFCRIGCKLYWCFARERRDVVVQNLLPAVNHDQRRAKLIAAELADEFARKLADLWRYESGRSMDRSFGELTGWEHFLAAQKKGKGVLLLTPHLGNWEFGAPLLARRDVKLLVITLAEPGDGFTEMRQASRARWGIETLVIGDNPFAFVEIIKRLEAGATVALLVDRPPAASAVEVELFGRPFAASIAAAELARASGCSLLPVYLPRTDEGYAAHILPEVDYDRRALGDREARRQLTQQILRAFEPAIRQHLDQWFHFVSIWPRRHAAGQRSAGTLE